MERPEQQSTAQVEFNSTAPQLQEISGSTNPVPDDSTANAQEIDLQVNISSNGMQAFLSLHANPPEPYPFTMETIEQAIMARGVVEGILIDEIQQVLNNQGYVSDLLIAKGIPPIEGEDARIEYLFDPSPKLHTPETEGQIDWHKTNLIQQVEENQPVARKIPVKLGVSGVTVSGGAVAPYKVHDIQLPSGRGTKTDEFDPNQLLAAVAGAVRLDGKRIIVDSVLNIPRDVDFSIGNIDFNGSIKLGGSVLPGFRVRATGDIRIEGYVEGATIESGESVWISKGVLGQANEITVRAGKDVVVKFARNASILAGGNITVQSEAILCSLQSGGTISVGSPERKQGRIIGGQVTATVAVHAVDVGTEKESATIISIAPPAASANKKTPAPEARMSKLQRDHSAMMIEVSKLINRKMVSASSWTSSHEELLTRLTQATNQMEEELYNLENLPVTEPEEEEKKAPPRVVVHGTLFPGTQIIIGRTSRKFLQKLNHVQLVLTDENSSIVSLAI